MIGSFNTFQSSSCIISSLLYQWLLYSLVTLLGAIWCAPISSLGVPNTGQIFGLSHVFVNEAGLPRPTGMTWILTLSGCRISSSDLSTTCQYYFSLIAKGGNEPWPHCIPTKLYYFVVQNCTLIWLSPYMTQYLNLLG